MTDQSANSTTLQQHSSNYSTASAASSLTEVVDRTIRREFPSTSYARQGQSTNSPTTLSEPPNFGQTVVRQRSVEPSLQDVLSTPFIDVRMVGIESWPITGLQMWEGRVVDVADEYFTAELTSMSDDATTGPLRADFRNDSLELADRSVAVGDLFYMTSRKVRTRGRLGTSYSLQVRRSGNWTEADVAEIRDRTRARLEMLNKNVE